MDLFPSPDLEIVSSPFMWAEQETKRKSYLYTGKHTHYTLSLTVTQYCSKMKRAGHIGQRKFEVNFERKLRGALHWRLCTPPGRGDDTEATLLSQENME
jgi:hypothetical protein